MDNEEMREKYYKEINAEIAKRADTGALLKRAGKRLYYWLQIGKSLESLQVIAKDIHAVMKDKNSVVYQGLSNIEVPRLNIPMLNLPSFILDEFLYRTEHNSRFGYMTIKDEVMAAYNRSLNLLANAIEPLFPDNKDPLTEEDMESVRIMLRSVQIEFTAELKSLILILSWQEVPDIIYGLPNKNAGILEFMGMYGQMEWHCRMMGVNINNFFDDVEKRFRYAKLLGKDEELIKKDDLSIQTMRNEFYNSETYHGEHVFKILYPDD